mmetsp:Transcript_37969/g.74198  ORF Transcript_37969/g.74198 Transcript_37969/m.74198 type:complete len:371 (+) Transcript_37969:3-1115(+)
MRLWAVLLLLLLLPGGGDGLDVQQCGDPVAGLCSDGNLESGDGCSDQCIVEKLAVQRWYEGPECGGKMIKMVAKNFREYLEPFGVCESGAACTCPYDVFPKCADGSTNLFNPCSCLPPSCATFKNKCKIWMTPNSTRVWSYTTNCTNSWPQITTVSQDWATSQNIINKQWSLTKSRGIVFPLADISAWEFTRRRAVGIGDPDMWKVWSAGKCVPMTSSLIKMDARATEFEILDYYNERTRRRCDENCTECRDDDQSSAVLCKDALNCLIVSPGKCMSCIGGVANESIIGFLAHPGPPAPETNFCVPCAYAPFNAYYGESACSGGLGCGDCVTGMACGSCGEQLAPEVACGDQRLGGLPYYWITGGSRRRV